MEASRAGWVSQGREGSTLPLSLISFYIHNNKKLRRPCFSIVKHACLPTYPLGLLSPPNTRFLFFFQKNIISVFNLSPTNACVARGGPTPC